jgi:uncharacterized protein (DUF924 family)
MADADDIAAIHDFWLGPEDGRSFARQFELWFGKSEETDAEIRTRFGDLAAQAAAGALDRWAESDAGLVALLILLDQFPRNLHRGTAEAFAADDRALALAKETVRRQRDLDLPLLERVFVYLPYEHSEDLEDQERSVALFTALEEEVPDAELVKWAQAHYDIIRRFGRFPHRNAALGRETTPEEAAFLEEPGSSF